MNIKYVLFNIVFLFTTLCNFSLCSAQNPEIDSLLKEIKKVKEDSAKAILHLDIGNQYSFIGYFELASQNYMEALRYFEKKQMKRYIGKVYNSLAANSIDLSTMDKAVEYGEKAAQLTKGTPSYLYTLSNLGVAYYNQPARDYVKAKQAFSELLELLKTQPNAYLEMATYINFGDMYYSLNRVKDAESMFKKALKTAEEMGIEMVCGAKLGLAYCEMNYGNIAKSEKLTLEALASADEEEIWLDEQRALEFLGDLSMLKHDFASMHRYYNKADSLEQIIISEKMLRATEEHNIKYETEQKDVKILKISMQNRFYLLLLLLLLLVVVVVVAIFFSTKRKKQLVEQKVLILEKEEQFIASQSLLEGEIAERNRLAKDLHDGLGGLLVGTKMVFTSMHKSALNDEEYAKVAAMMDESIQEMRRIAHNLMPDILDKNGLKCALEHFCEQLPNVSFSYFGEDKDLPPKHKKVCYKIAYELLSNAIKHSKASTINLTVVQEEKLLNMLIADNGVGFNPNHLSEGMGLKNIQERVSAFGGKMDINTDSNGTEISVELPIS